MILLIPYYFPNFHSYCNRRLEEPQMQLGNVVDEVSRAMWITTGWNQKWVGSKKIKWTRKKIYVWRKNFSFCQPIFSFSFGFSTFVLEHFGLWKHWILLKGNYFFTILLLNYFLKNELNFLQKMNKNCLFPINFP